MALGPCGFEPHPRHFPGLADPHDVHRETVDLLFFPTGGGKTEAYLGLAGVAIVLRRLPITHVHALAVGVLPPPHRDPFDRVLVAQVQIEGLTLVTADSTFAHYDVRLIRVGARQRK